MTHSKETCSIDGCASPVISSRGMCSKHVQRWARYGDPLFVKQNKDVIASGTKFGKLTVLRLTPERYASQRVYLCLCDCGKERAVAARELRAGRTTSCGCARGQHLKTHGLSRKHPLWATWYSMLHRCRNPNCDHWKNYGGRGIKVCQRWQGPDGFPNFVADMGPKPDPSYTLDRIDNDGNYEPGNCRWATRLEQAQNKRPMRPSRKKVITDPAASR